jgi:methyl-accepting chemotaxis protein
MKIRIKLSLMMIAIMAVIVTGIAALLLRQASGISLDLSKRGIKYLTGQQVEFWKGREEGYLRALRTLAGIMAEYESVPADERRDRYDHTLLSAIIAETSMIRLYTVWKPNALDGVDARHAGRIGSTPAGQYAISYTRETGQILGRTAADYEDATAYLNSPDAKKDRVDNPFPETINGKEVYLLRMMVPVISPRTGEVVGSVGCILDIAIIQSTVQETVKTYDEIAAVTIYSGNGMIMGHLVPERVGKMLIDVDTIFGPYTEEANQAVLNGTGFRCNTYSPVLESNVEVLLDSFRIGNSNQTWSIMVVVTDKYVLREVNAITRFTVILAAAALLAAIVIVYIVLYKSTAPIIRVTDKLKDISEGEGDLTRTIVINSRDEVGDLAKYFNQTLEKIKSLIMVIKKETGELSEVGGDLAGNMTETAAAINEIAANLQSIKGRVISQSAGVTETNATMELIVANINKLNDHVESQSGNVSLASSAIEEMVANIRSVTQTLVGNADNVKALRAASDVGRTGLSEVAQDIQEIARESEGLLEINSVMENIASQTNLLSMNAAIEAAHAGEAGRGFAVVADEIRKLAESSGEQSKTISGVLKKIKNSIDKIMGSTENVLTEFGAIDSSVRTVAEQEENIRSAMEEQGAGSQQLLQVTNDLNDLTRQVKSGSHEMLEGSHEVIRESRDLEKITQEITGGMNEMASGADQINLAIHHINEISDKNREGIDALMREVARFKVE